MVSLPATSPLQTVYDVESRIDLVYKGGCNGGQPEAFQTRYISRTPLKRMANKDNLRGAVAYLASDMSSYVTGHNLEVNGGWGAW